MINRPQRHCWCGNNELKSFSPDYLVCTKCGTLVSQTGLTPEQTLVCEDSKDFYGKEYWLSHQSQDLGFPNIYQRTRLDLSERSLYWLRTLLTYKLPPARVLELGSAHGAFVALMRWAGFDATGLELSPWVVDFAQKTFNIPMLLGRVEDQQLEQQSFDAIVLYDVLEHLPNPLATMQYCFSLLKPDGIFIIQTPNYIENKTYAEMVAKNDKFMEQLMTIEHLYLFSERAVEMFFKHLGCNTLHFKPALFDYDMYFVVSRQPLAQNTVEQISSSLATIPSGRMVQALFDKADEVDQFQKKWLVAEDDRAARLRVIEQQGEENTKLQTQLTQVSDHLQVIEADRTERLQVINQQATQIEQMEQHLQEIIEANHAAYLEVINEQAAQIKQMEQHLQKIEADRAARLQVINEQAAQIEQMGQHLQEIEADRAARLQVINEQAAQIEQMGQHLQGIEADQAARLQVINEQAAQIEQMEQQLYNLQIQLLVRILRRLKLLKFQPISSSVLMEE
ncbi:MAG: methyltransferase domain-containing protein [Nostoc sp.]|uniref:methyltransferase domain-containing protein n=1 Tax=Nostoc sp. TaxID=1180 RepID=UPI002FFBD911